MMKKKSMKWVAILSVSIFVVVIGGVAFLYKITEFAETYLKDDLKSFGAISVVSYLVGFFGILFFTLWGVFKGHFRDIERPKYRMLELDEEIERMGNVYREESKSEPSELDELSLN
ncbi:MAG: cbb3-type cytochrome oxidase assembly protein [bacterium]